MDPLSGLPVATALIAGLIHALEADHLAAVTAFIARRPHPLRGMGFGIRWGMGHSAALLLAGGAVVVLGFELREPVVRGLEVAVGALLVGLGFWAAWGASGESDDAAGQPAARTGGIRHSPGGHGATALVGAAHGLAGTAGFLAIVPALLLSSPWSAGGYLLLFGTGTVAAMGAYGLFAGLIFQRAGARAARASRAIRVTTGAASILIGAIWMSGALG